LRKFTFTHEAAKLDAARPVPAPINAEMSDLTVSLSARIPGFAPDCADVFFLRQSLGDPNRFIEDRLRLLQRLPATEGKAYDAAGINGRSSRMMDAKPFDNPHAVRFLHLDTLRDIIHDYIVQH
jgi:hypothetical protein